MQEGGKSRQNERTRMVPMQKVHGVAWELGGAVPDVPGETQTVCWDCTCQAQRDHKTVAHPSLNRRSPQLPGSKS